ncbi:PREDICTED: cytochrome P450 CYP736A12-like [Ipomoea nil]|uniref:cytochrome P450 CYP736A12-like n=1 Tax=Ipomoea nil TaxID=35883 RepID=UPI0009014B14|nr:PREDICTED: cytochrome P450 CYP736A12-like [Ipomoea nil]
MVWIWTTVAVAIAVYLLLRELLNIKKKLPPGPKGIPILGHLHLLGKTPHQDLHKLAKKHGPIMYMRWGFVPAIIVSSPEIAEVALKTCDHVFADRPYHEASMYIAYGQRNFIFSKYGSYWRNVRKMCTLQLLSSHKINSMQSMRMREVSLLIGSLKRAAAHGGAAVDLSAMVSSLSADMSFLMVVGKKYLSSEEIVAVVREVVHLAAMPNLGDYIPYLGILDFQGLTRRMKAVAKVFDGFLEKIIEEHVQSKAQKETKDFVDTMLEIMQSGETDFEFDRRHVKAIMLDMISASMDTSATSVEWIMTELIRHPQAMKKLQKEVEEEVGMERMVEESDLEKLKYLDMVVKEGMRLHPAVPLLHHQSMEDCQVKGYHIPKGSRVVINVLALQKDPIAWPEPEKFIPERFAGNSVDLRGRDFELLPFGSGRRSCPGVQLGIIVVSLVVAQLVHCFNWELPNGMHPNELDMSELFGLATGRAKPLMAVPTYRLHN